MTSSWTKLDLFGLLNWAVLVAIMLRPIKLPSTNWYLFELFVWAIPLVADGIDDWFWPVYVIKGLKILTWIIYSLILLTNLSLIWQLW